MAARKYEVWVCPSCGEQIITEPELDPKRHKYVRGHYHDPPADWPEGEDPWFDAVAVTAIDARDIEPLVEAARRGLEDLEDVHAPSVGPLQAALAPFDSEEEK